eukprot:15474083-Alexandrium_andersonii.AAC.1
MAPPPHPDGAAPGGVAGEATLGETSTALHPDGAGLGAVALPPPWPSPWPQRSSRSSLWWGHRQWCRPGHLQ